MKHLLLLSIVLFSCQSQADKDRAEMQRLIDDKKRLESELPAMERARWAEMSKHFDTLSDKEVFGNGDDPAIKQIRSKYPRIPNIKDSLYKIETRIVELKLLMGK